MKIWRVFSAVILLAVLNNCQSGGPTGSEDVTAPHEVSDLTGEKGNASVVLEWVDPTDSDFDHVSVSWTNGDKKQTEVVKGVQTLTVCDLQNFTEYLFTLSTVDASGNCSAGIAIAVTPVDETVDVVGDVTELSVTPLKNKIELTWKDPVTPYLSKIVLVCTPSEGGTSSSLSVNAGVQTALFSGLVNDVSYTITLKAENSFGYQSSGVTAAAVPTVSEVSDLTAENLRSSVRLTWQEPSRGCSTVNVYYRVPGGAFSSPISVAAGVQSLVVSPLENDIEYTFLVKVVDSYNDESDGVSISATPDGTAPMQVSGVSVAELKGELQISWTDPADDDFEKIIVTCNDCLSPELSQEIVPGVCTVTFSSLVNDRIHYINIYSVDKLGNVSEPYFLMAIPDGTAPAQVSNVVVQEFNGKITLSWIDPVDADLGKIILTCNDTYLPERQIEVEPGVCTATFDELTNDIVHYINIYSVDNVENTSEPYFLMAVPDGTAPSAVSGLSATISSEAIVLSWIDPDDTDFSTVQITSVPSLSSETFEVAKGTMSLTIPSPKIETRYTFSVVSVDGCGNCSSAAVVSAALLSHTPGDKFAYHVTETDGSLVDFNLVYVPGKKIYTDYDDTLTNDSVTESFYLSEKEVTYQIWKIVYDWAINNGYTFINAGYIGSNNTGSVLQPVVYINWRDILIWYNALTEYYNAVNGTSMVPVYYTDEAMTNPIRQVTNISTISWVMGSQDMPYVKSDADGFRFLSVAEWMVAARYKEDINNDGDILDEGEYYPGKYVSGAYGTTSTYISLAAWYASNSDMVTHEVGLKPAIIDSNGLEVPVGNALGLFDICGNAWEWCFDHDASGYKYHAGGSFGNSSGKNSIDVTSTRVTSPRENTVRKGIRIGKTFL